jgi:hypothetical protein
VDRGGDYFRKSSQNNIVSLKLQIWDESGRDTFPSWTCNQTLKTSLMLITRWIRLEQSLLHQFQVPMEHSSSILPSLLRVLLTLKWSFLLSPNRYDYDYMDCTEGITNICLCGCSILLIFTIFIFIALKSASDSLMTLGAQYAPMDLLNNESYCSQTESPYVQLGCGKNTVCKMTRTPPVRFLSGSRGI